MDQFVNFPNQLSVDELLELAKARQLSKALDMVFKAIDIASSDEGLSDE